MEALASASPHVVRNARLITFKPAYGGTQMAMVKLPRDDATELIKAGRIRIGWVNCRLRPRVHIIRCFRCRGFGHIAVECASKQDRSKECNKCGQEGHKAVICKNDPHCSICEGEKISSGHPTGSRSCAALRTALKGRTQQ
ncbi:uncharacterized protein LOC143915851 [Arctopsyche grandis]|uniref:uncharacterized protein LOC143915851 n=1 Tax=Arctopsyche grandis TaxID=121162 RepID=UPI00406D8B35